MRTRPTAAILTRLCISQAQAYGLEESAARGLMIHGNIFLEVDMGGNSLCWVRNRGGGIRDLPVLSQMEVIKSESDVLGCAFKYQ